MFGLLAAAAHAEIFPLAPDQDMIGEPGQTEAEQQDTLPDIARQYHLGFDEIIAANPGVDTWLPGAGTVIRLPMQHLLPDVPRTGIVINLPDGRLYYFRTDQGGNHVVEAVSHQRRQNGLEDATGGDHHRQEGKKARLGIRPNRCAKPTSRMTAISFRQPFPRGRTIRLGEYAMRLGIPGGAYLIHGTNKPVGVGMQITHGCIRLYPEDIEYLFGEVPVGMSVRIVNQRIKTGWVDGALYLEVHHPLDGVDLKDVEDLTGLTRSIVAATAQRRVIIDWDTAERVFQEANGIPTRISIDRWIAPADRSGPRARANAAVKKNAAAVCTAAFKYASNARFTSTRTS